MVHQYGMYLFLCNFFEMRALLGRCKSAILLQNPAKAESMQRELCRAREPKIPPLPQPKTPQRSRYHRMWSNGRGVLGSGGIGLRPPYVSPPVQRSRRTCLRGGSGSPLSLQPEFWALGRGGGLGVRAPGFRLLLRLVFSFRLRRRRGLFSLTGILTGFGLPFGMVLSTVFLGWDSGPGL